jgi:hypothetical protein
MNRSVLARLGAVLLAAVCAVAAARSTYDDVTVVAIQPMAGGSGLRVEDASTVRRVMDEINAERGGAWEAHRGAPGRCAVRLTFLAGTQRVGRLWLEGDRLVEPTGVADDRGLGRTLMRGDLRTTRRLAAQVSGC